MIEKVFIGCGAGFSGDRFDASIPIVKKFKNINAPKYLMFEVLAERTLAIAQQFRLKNPEEGYSIVDMVNDRIRLKMKRLDDTR